MKKVIIISGGIVALLCISTGYISHRNQHQQHLQLQQQTYNVDVPQLGIQLTLPYSIRDLEQSIDTGAEGKIGVDFSTTRLVSIGGASCKAGAVQSVSPYPLGQLIRANEKPAQVAAERKANPEEALGEYIVAVGDEYLYYQSPPDEPCSQNPAAVQMQNQQKVLLKQAFKTAKNLE